MERLGETAETAVREAALRARRASLALGSASDSVWNAALLAISEALNERSAAILKANEADLREARVAGLPEPFLKRLALSVTKLREMSAGVLEISKLPDPLGRVLETRQRPNGLIISKVSVPFGVIGIIYESRPGVTSDAAALCLKSGNAAVLRGGSESRRTNLAIMAALHNGLEKAGLPADCVQYIDGHGRESVQAMMRSRGLIDLLIPRGGAGLIKTVVEGSLVPVIETGVGNCHIYVHEDADLNMAASIVVNAKCQNPAVCNAVETLLVDGAIAGRFLPVIARKLMENDVELRGCPRTLAIVPEAEAASDADWSTEYLGLTLAVRVVDGIDAAISHIARHGTGHSEAIVTGNRDAARKFQTAVDAACVYVNASTRFTDGGEFGFGAEIGISTQKLHARGPMGLAEMTTYKYLITGDGQVR